MATAEFRYVTTQIYQPSYTVTNAAGNGSTILYTADNDFQVGQLVTITGVSPSQYNVTNAVIVARDLSIFIISSTITGTYVSGGSATTYNQILAELPFTGVNYTSQLNSIGTFQGHVLLSGINSSQLNAYEGTVPGKTILWVLYTDPITYASVPVWSGVIWAREYDSISQTLSISAQEMLSLYNRRRISTTKDYSVNPLDADGYDPAYISYQLMKYAEALIHGKTGLVYNNVSTEYQTKKLYNGYELKSVFQAIKDLAANFFDFKIAPLVIQGSLINQFYIGSTSSPLGPTYSATSLTAAVFQFPGNVIEYKFPEDAGSATNRLYGLGYGANNSKIVATAIDPTKISFNNMWPLLEDSANYTDVGDLQLLKDLTLGQLNATSYPPTTVEIVIPPYVDPYYTEYNIGQQVRLEIKDDYFPSGYSEILRIVAISVTPGENGPSRVTITLTRLLAAGTVS